MTKMNYRKKISYKNFKESRRKASMIAELAGLKLGRIIEFKEATGINNLDINIKDIYFAMAQNRLWDVNKNNLFGYKCKTVIIKFQTQ